tara:strand:- start:1305 stop:1538 length:234 start_codon:yes stop_codon:yes gene_type:complete
MTKIELHFYEVIIRELPRIRKALERVAKKEEEEIIPIPEIFIPQILEEEEEEERLQMLHFEEQKKEIIIKEDYNIRR